LNSITTKGENLGTLKSPIFEREKVEKSMGRNYNAKTRLYGEN